jgi:hypothetical protein
MPAELNRFITAVCCLTLLAIGAGCGGKNHASGSPTSPGQTHSYAISLDFTRTAQAGTDPFKVTATLTDGGTPVKGAELTAESANAAGTLTPIIDCGDGTYTFTVTPSRTGEYPVTVSYGSLSVTQTPLVLSGVDAGWEQPMSVSGYVNTQGYEDGVTITPDGEYLFVQTGPSYFSGFFIFITARDAGGAGGDRLTPSLFTDPWMDTLAGTYTAPERPGFFSGRFDGMTQRYNAPSWGMPDGSIPNWPMSTMFYGFKRQADGSFKEPFYLAFEDEGDGIIGPYGLSFRMNGNGTARAIFSLRDPDQTKQPGQIDYNGDGTPDFPPGFDVYTNDITLGVNNVLGRYLYSGTPGTPPQRDPEFFPSKPVNFGTTGTQGTFGTQGNPSYYESADGNIAVFTDDEYDSAFGSPASDDYHNISVYTQTSGSWPGGVWEKTVLPPTINSAPVIQPCFSGNALYYTSDTEVWSAGYSGTNAASSYAISSNWNTPAQILSKDTGGAIGSIVTLGEPTVCTYKGEQYLYFVYGYVRAIKTNTGAVSSTVFYDIDLNAGYIKKR